MRTKLFFALLACLTLSIGSALAADDLFSKKCQSCHGKAGDGKKDDGSWVGVAKTMKLAKDAGGPGEEVLNLKSDAAKKLTDADIEKAIAEGKGKMKGMKEKLSADEIKALVKEVRGLQK